MLRISRAVSSKISTTSGEELWRRTTAWKMQMEGIREMRRARDADVDTVGIEAIVERGARERVGVPAPTVRFQTLVAAMLSSQTRDAVTADAMVRLREMWGGAAGFTPESLLSMTQEQLAATIRPVSFHNNKARHLLATAQVLVDDYGGDIPQTAKEMKALPGVGPKMTYLTMSLAWDRDEGICVDTHVHRICNRLGWVETWNHAKGKSQNPEKTRRQLEAWLPRTLWREINPLLVGFGQQFCSANAPRCSACAINHICPTAFTHGGDDRADKSRRDDAAGASAAERPLLCDPGALLDPRPQNREEADDGTSEIRTCHCGDPAVELVVKKTGKNTGRRFRVCAKPQFQQCRYFEWVDDDDDLKGGSGAAADEGRRRRKMVAAKPEQQTTTMAKPDASLDDFIENL